MSIPTFEECMMPALSFIGSRNISSTSDIMENIVDVFNLSKEEKDELLPKSKQKRIYNRVAWSRFYLLKAGLINTKKRGAYVITESGRELLNQKLQSIDQKFLYEKYPLFKEWIDSSRSRKQESSSDTVSYEKLDPYERLEKSFVSLESNVLNDLQDHIRKIDFKSFEKLILELLKKIGYGGPDGKWIRHTGKSGDEGVDGEINQDRLGLDRIYMQAKRYKESTVGRTEIQKFVGTLSSKKSKKGLFITTSQFSKKAEEYIEKVDSRLVLIDGPKLAELLYKYDLGVKTKKIFKYKEINEEFFEEEVSSLDFEKIA